MGRTLTHGSLFSGIGGFDLAARWMGWSNLFHCEWNPFCQKILQYHFPESTSYADIKKTDFTEWRGRVDVLSGGFPCQPFSVAGRRRGTEDDRYLWPEMLRAIREIQPAWVVGENVGGILTMVQPDGSPAVERSPTLFGEDDVIIERERYVVETICGDIEREGYSVQPLLIPACAVGAPHRRDRVWFVAHADGERLEAARAGEQAERDSGLAPEWAAANTDGGFGNAFQIPTRRLERQGILFTERQEMSSEIGGRYSPENADGWREFPTQPPLCGGDDGIPPGLDGITFPRWRNESVKAYGNAIVPQVAYEIFMAIATEECCNPFVEQNDK